jgi:1,4-dihydroxy-6-naphthoate synthase
MSSDISRKIKIAYSPDSDDAFMMGPMETKAIDLRGYAFEFVREDIQELNSFALSEEAPFDVTAISIAAYPFIQSKYKILDIGASIGDAYGPAVMLGNELEGTELSQLRGKKIAVPGLQTSAYFAAKICFPGNEFVPMSFLDILPAIKAGDVDGGILIHELQMLECDFAYKAFDLGVIWKNKTELPLPLGTNAIRRSLPKPVQKDLREIMLASIDHALEHRDEYLSYIQKVGNKDFAWSKEQDDAYIQRYVNENSREFTPEVQKAMSYLFEHAHALGICPQVAHLKEDLIHA